MITPPAQINGIGLSTMKRREGICRDNNVSSSSKGKEEACMRSCSQIGRGGGPLSTGVLLGSFPWPPRSYSCSFCKREFKSAQALGGHMNVHRRDKARLRHYSPPPCDLLNSNPNPNPNPCPANGTNKTVPYGIPPLIPNLNMPPPSSACCSWDEENLVASSHSATTLSSSMDAVKALSGGGEWKDYLMERDKAAKGYLLNERKLVRLDMEVACHGLDLELRLGYMFN